MATVLLVCMQRVFQMHAHLTAYTRAAQTTKPRPDLHFYAHNFMHWCVQSNVFYDSIMQSTHFFAKSLVHISKMDIPRPCPFLKSGWLF